MGRGPLVLVDHAAFMEFAAVMCMPVIPAVGEFVVNEGHHHAKFHMLLTHSTLAHVQHSKYTCA